MAVSENALPLSIEVSEGTSADCKHALSLIEDLAPQVLIADRAYDTNEIREYAMGNGLTVVIPSKRNRKKQCDYDKELYKVRHIVENVFLQLKRWRGIATRYAKLGESFATAVKVRCISLWAIFRSKSYVDTV